MGLNFPRPRSSNVEREVGESKGGGCSERLASSSKVTEQQGQKPSLGGSATRASTACLLCVAQTKEGDLWKCILKLHRMKAYPSITIGVTFLSL